MKMVTATKPFRFSDTGAALYDLSTHFVVHCPRCQGKAWVLEDGRLNCTVCFHSEKQGKWYGAATATVQVKCRECYSTLYRVSNWNGQWKKLDLQCPKCGDKCAYEAKVSRQYVDNGLMTDRVFGLPLWLQKERGNDLFWAYNYEHLRLLEQYIAALLRERGIEPFNTIKKNSSMVSRLPMFIKKAGNRSDLLKTIEALIAK